MIDLLDNLLRQILMDQIAEITDEAQVRFQPPDQDWRTYVSNLVIAANPANAVNVYLADVRENRQLRSNERVRTVANGFVNEEPAPVRMDLHYLISAWSPATVSPAIEPTLDEHALLYQSIAALVHSEPFNPSRVYPAGSAALNAWPEAFRNADLPAVVAPVEGFSKLAEFWSGMGQGSLWRPALYLIVTVPVALAIEAAGPMVTTRITEYRITGHPETGEVWIDFGGHVRDSTNPLPDGTPAPVAEAWVELLTLANERLQLTRTNALGRFLFTDLGRGQYQIHVSAAGLGELFRNIDVPSLTGEYDLQF
ncbi:MAG: Pvc16 family protein [Blastocatellia bacterium]